MILITKELNFLFQKEYCRIEGQNNICINVFCCENNLTYRVYLSDQKFHNSMDLLLISDGIKSHYVYIKDLNRFVRYKTKNKNKKYFFKCCLKCFSSENFFDRTHRKLLNNKW